MIKKRTKLFEEFLNEHATAQITVTKDIKIKKSVEDKIRLAVKMQEDLKKIVDEYKKKIDPLTTALDKIDSELIDELNAIGVSTVKVQGLLENEKLIAKLITTKGRETHSYKDLWEEALKKMNEQTQKVMKAIQEARKKKNPDKQKMEYEKQVNEGVKEALSSLKAWVKGLWNDLKETFKGFFGAADNLEKVTKKILAAK